jgi:hypothetical protein
MNITLMVQGAHLTAGFSARNVLEKQMFSTESEIRTLPKWESYSWSDAIRKLGVLHKMGNF